MPRAASTHEADRLKSSGRRAPYEHAQAVSHPTPGATSSDDTTPAIAYDAPIRFIYETFLRAFPEDPTPIVETDWDKGTLTAAAGTNTFTRSEVGVLGSGLLGGFDDDGFKVGHKITVTGFSNPANNGTFYVAGVTDTQLTVDGLLADETASGDEQIAVRVAKTAPITITASATNNTFTRSDPGGSFVADGFVIGLLADVVLFRGECVGVQRVACLEGQR